MTNGGAESFQGLLLRYRGRSSLTQRQLAERLGIHRRSVQEWEIGVTYPSAERLEALVRVLVEAGGLQPGEETAEAQALWAAVQREAPRTHAPFDPAWFARLLTQHAAPPSSPAASRHPLPLGEGWGEGTQRRQDWGDAPDVLEFVNRIHERANLSAWVLGERCRLVAVLGMGGIGKTSLVAKVAHEVAASFERVYWRSLRDAPTPGDWLAGAIGFLSDQQLAPPAADAERVALLLQLLRERRCLLVLDNFETLLEPGESDGSYRRGLAGFGRLLEVLGGAAHQSCVVLTSREAPAELAAVGGGAVRTLRLGGLGADAVQRVLAPKQLVGSTEQWTELTDRLGGNPLALKLVGHSIRELFGGDLGAFLDEGGAGSVVRGIRQLLAEQIERGSAPEQHVLRALAVEREPVTLAGLQAAVGPRIGRGAVLEAIEVLGRRSLVERADTAGPAAFTLQPLVLEYVTDCPAAA